MYSFQSSSPKQKLEIHFLDSIDDTLIHPQKLTVRPLKKDHFNRKYIFQLGMFVSEIPGVSAVEPWRCCRCMLVSFSFSPNFQVPNSRKFPEVRVVKYHWPEFFQGYQKKPFCDQTCQRFAAFLEGSLIMRYYWVAFEKAVIHGLGLRVPNFSPKEGLVKGTSSHHYR